MPLKAVLLPFGVVFLSLYRVLLHLFDARCHHVRCLCNYYVMCFQAVVLVRTLRCLVTSRGYIAMLRSASVVLRGAFVAW